MNSFPMSSTDCVAPPVAGGLIRSRYRQLLKHSKEGIYMSLMHVLMYGEQVCADIVSSGTHRDIEMPPDSALFRRIGARPLSI